MLAQERQRHILELIRSGVVTVKELSEKMEVSPMTVRRDLAALERDGMLVRVHGGAYSPEINGATEIPYRRKRAEHLEEKRRIGRKAAELVGVGETLILDAGSTTLEVARHLKENTRLTVVSNDLEVLGELARRGGMTVIDTGGMLLESVYTLAGPRTEAMLRSVHVHRVFLGADAVSLDDGVTNRTLHEVAVKQAMIEAASQVILVAASHKFQQRVFATVCPLEQLDVIVTDTGLPADVAARIEERGVKLILT